MKKSKRIKYREAADDAYFGEKPVKCPRCGRRMRIEQDGINRCGWCRHYSPFPQKSS